VSGRFFYVEENPHPEDIHVDGIVILGDLETFGDLEGARVVIFNDSAGASAAIKEIDETQDIDIAFKAALDGDAEELSLSRIIKFYLANGM